MTNTVDKFCPGAKIIHIDVDPASISKTVMADIPIVGPVQSVLTELLAQIERCRRKTLTCRIRRAGALVAAD